MQVLPMLPCFTQSILQKSRLDVSSWWQSELSQLSVTSSRIACVHLKAPFFCILTSARCHMASHEISKQNCVLLIVQI